MVKLELDIAQIGSKAKFGNRPHALFRVEPLAGDRNQLVRSVVAEQVQGCLAMMVIGEGCLVEDDLPIVNAVKICPPYSQNLVLVEEGVANRVPRRVNYLENVAVSAARIKDGDPHL